MANLVSAVAVSNNPVNIHYATTGNVITTTATFDVVPSTAVTGTFNGAGITFTQVGSTVVYTHQHTTLIGDTQGLATIVVHWETTNNFTVLSGNTVTIDTAPPVATVAYTTSGDSVTRPKVGDVHTVTLTINEQLSVYPRISFGGVSTSRLDNKVVGIHPIFKWTNIDTLTWQATYTITGKEMIPRGFIFNITDMAGNISVFGYNISGVSVFSYYNRFYYFDHFFNQTQGRYYLTAGGTNTIVAPIALDETGIVKQSVTATSDVAGYNISSNYGTFLYESYTTSFQLTVKISDLTAQAVGTNESMVRIGFVDSDSAIPNYGIYFEVDKTNNRWKTCTALASAVTANSVVNAANVFKSGGTFARFMVISYSGGQARFFMDGVLIDTQSYFIPDPIGSSAFPSPGFYITKTLGSTLHTFKVDYLELIMNKNQLGDYSDDFSIDYNI